MANTLPALSPTFNDDNPFPSIPAIINDDLRTRVFTHRSLHARLNQGIFEDHSNDPSPDNEKYKLLGDTVLGIIITSLLLDMYPNLHSGSYMKIRALIIGTSTFAAISCRYALPAQLKANSAQAISLSANPNTQADVFKSYVGGLYLDQGLTAVEQWLKMLFKPYITEAYIQVRAQHGLSSPPLSVPPQLPLSTVSSNPAGSSSGIDTTSLTINPLSSAPSTGYVALFNEQLQRDKRTGKFHDECVSEGAVTPIWTARAEVDGEVLGHGKGGTKKTARNAAAKEALVCMGIPAGIV